MTPILCHVSVIKRLVTLLLERAKLEANLTALEKQARQAALAAGLAPVGPRERAAEPNAGAEKSAAAAGSGRSEDASALKAEMRRAEELQTRLDTAVRGNTINFICYTVMLCRVAILCPPMTFASRASTFDMLLRCRHYIDYMKLHCSNSQLHDYVYYIPV